MSVVQTAYTFCSCFEGELLLELMLKYWHHPLCGDADFRNQLLESAAEVLITSMNGQRLFEDIPPEQVNFVAAIYYAESAFARDPDTQFAKEQTEARLLWLENIRRTLPSCFCDQDDLLS